MCAIFGLGFQRGHNIRNNDMIYNITNRLFETNMQRGGTASGIAFCSTNEIHVLKKNVDGKKFIKLPEYKTSIRKYMTVAPLEGAKDRSVCRFPPVSAIGHCRLKTKGSELFNVNNHPIVREDVIGVHNGIISNDDALFRLNINKFKRNGQVDSEIIFAMIEYYSYRGADITSAIQKAASEMYGNYACAMVHRHQNYSVYLFRNGNPCIILHYKDIGLIVWSSMESYIIESMKGYSVGKPEEILLPSGQGINIDLFRNKFHRFQLEPDKPKGRVYNA